jgi:hypothetical protein
LAEDRFANGSKTHVHGERDLASLTPGPSLDFGLSGLMLIGFTIVAAPQWSPWAYF